MHIAKLNKIKVVFICFDFFFFALSTIKYFLIGMGSKPKTLVIKSEFWSEKIFMFQRNGAIR